MVFLHGFLLVREYTMHTTMSCPNFCPKWSHWKSPLGSVGISHLSRKGLPARHFHLQGDSWLWCTLSRTSGRGPSSSCEGCGFPECWAQQGYWDPEDSWWSQHARLLFFFFCTIIIIRKTGLCTRALQPTAIHGIYHDRLARPCTDTGETALLAPPWPSGVGKTGRQTMHWVSQPTASPKLCCTFRCLVF